MTERGLLLTRAGLGVVLHGAVAAGPAVLSMALARVDLELGHRAGPKHALFWADTAHNASVTLGADSTLGRLEDYAVAMLTFNVGVYALFPLAFVAYMRGSVRMVSEAVFLSYFFAQVVVCLVTVLTPLDAVARTVFCLVMALLLQFLAMEAFLPSSCHVAQQLVALSVALLLALAALQAASAMPAGDTATLVSVLAILPLARELCGAIAVHSAWRLASDEHVTGDKLRPNRAATWPLMAWVPATFSCATRWLVINIQSASLQAAAVAGICVLEAALAHTRSRRHRQLLSASAHKEILARSAKWIKPSREGEYVLAPEPIGGGGNGAAGGADIGDGPALPAPNFNEFYGVAVLLDAATDLSAILVAFAAVALGRNNVLYYRYPYYMGHAALFDEAPALDRAVLVTATQLGAAVVVHSFTALRSAARGVHITEAWRSRAMTWLPLLSIAVWFGASIAEMFMLSLDNFAACLGRDLCDCVAHGLRDPGVARAYCARLESP